MANNRQGAAHPVQRLSAVADTLVDTTRRSGEMGVAAAQTIGYRSAMMAAALASPTGFANPEFIRMGAEKVEATVEAMQGVTHGLTELGSTWVALLTGQTQAAVQALSDLAQCRTPADWAEVQRRTIAHMMDSGVHAALRTAEAAAAISAASLKPLHRKARANARRLAAEQA
ncbi:phasin family protein [Azospirillum griseum]|uniref:Phasin family protein n=1 Tax=Azospirillum griseum TaxID=2496639 RepID=A0A3S0K5M2_9PROT|nr:phasin family protein [Azospirillum griseum]RTR21490.1 phasin family protein [Azospirillum griseum]